MCRTTLLKILAVIALPMAAAACGDDDLPTAPTAPTPTAITETFENSINVNGARTHQFRVETTGSVSAVLTAVSPEGTTVGLSIGTFATTTGTCTTSIDRNPAVQGNTVVGNASVGDFCVRVYDAGFLTESASYTITVTHF
jgi:hypothetical protein